MKSSNNLLLLSSISYQLWSVTYSLSGVKLGDDLFCGRGDLYIRPSFFTSSIEKLAVLDACPIVLTASTKLVCGQVKLFLLPPEPLFC